MLHVLLHNWWLLALRGIFAFLFAGFVFSTQTVHLFGLLQAMALVSVVEMFGLFAFCAGVITVIAALRSLNKNRGWWLLFLDGAVACAIGVAAVATPHLTFVLLLRLIALWALIIGVFELLIARGLRRHVTDEWFLALSGGGSLLFGAAVWLGWASQIHQLILWLGSYALFSSLTMLGVALRLRRLRSQASLVAAHVISR